MTRLMDDTNGDTRERNETSLQRASPRGPSTGHFESVAYKDIHHGTATKGTSKSDTAILTIK